MSHGETWSGMEQLGAHWSGYELYADIIKSLMVRHEGRIIMMYKDFEIENGRNARNERVDRLFAYQRAYELVRTKQRLLAYAENITK